MGGGFDSGGYRFYKDILDRLSRPQRQSTWIPTKRDWRYANGVFRHTDLEDSPRDRTTWDDLDYDYNIVQALQSAEQYTLINDSDTEIEEENIVEATATAESAASNTCTPRSPVSRSPDDAFPRTSERFHSTSERINVMNYEIKDCQPLSPLPTTVEDDTTSGSSTPHEVPAPNPTSKDNVAMSEPPTDSHSDEVWHDETLSFSMSTIRGTLRDPTVRPSELVKNYKWYPDAVAVDALLPPGIPFSAKEICVYYPHHVRWQDVMLRLAHNDYRGSDILGIQAFFRGPHQDHMSAPVMNQTQRDAIQRLPPAFKTTGYEGNGDPNMYTEQLLPSAYLEKKLKGCAVPSFDDLLRGLKFLPSGHDARGPSQCLRWYLDVCNTLTPKLELNVLHTQALIRALRQPLQPAGSQNLNRLALEQWREQGALDRTEIITAARHDGIKASDEHCVGRSSGVQAVIDIREDHIGLKMYVRIPLRNLLAFPFLALHGIVSEALELGIYKAERRRAARKGMATPTKHVTANSTKHEDATEYISKRPRQAEPGELGTSAQTPKLQRKLDGGPNLLEVGRRDSPPSRRSRRALRPSDSALRILQARPFS